MIARAAGVLFSLCAAIAVLGLGAWGGGAFTPARAAGGPPSRATDELAYAKDGEIPVGDALEVNGQPLQLSLFYTSDAPSRVAQFYAEAFQARHMVPVASAEDRVAHVSAFDPDDGLQRFVNAVAQPDGQTLVMVGVTNPRKPPRLLNGAAAASFPVPEENRAFLGYRSEDAGSKAESAQFVTAQSPAQVADFYRKALAAQRWTENSGESSESMLMFARDGESLSVALQALDEKKGAAVFVNRLTGGGR